MKDGLELSIDGAIYEFIQIVSNRVTSTFETVLTINSQLSTILSHIYTCRVSNTLGEDSRTIEGTYSSRLYYTYLVSFLYTCT